MKKERISSILDSNASSVANHRKAETDSIEKGKELMDLITTMSQSNGDAQLYTNGKNLVNIVTSRQKKPVYDTGGAVIIIGPINPDLLQ